MTYAEAWEAITSGTVTMKVVTGEKQRTWGGWYRHDEVFADGERIGTIQVRRIPKSGRIAGRIESTTLDLNDRCVMGTDIAWLLKENRQCHQS